MLAPLSKTSDWVGTIRPLGSRCRRFGRNPCSVSHMASLLNLLGLFFFFFFAHFYSPASGQAVVTGVVPSPPRFLPSIFIAHGVQHSHCSSIFHRVLLTHALALSASQFVHMKNSQRMYTSMHSAGLELTKLTYTRLEVNLIRHRGDRQPWAYLRQIPGFPQHPRGWFFCIPPGISFLHLPYPRVRT